MHEDEALLVIDKPPGLSTLPKQGFNEPSVLRLCQRERRGGDPRSWRVLNKLDEDASGLVAIVKGQAAESASMSGAMERLMYIAVVGGHAEIGGEDGQGTIQSYLEDRQQGRVRSVPSGTSGPVLGDRRSAMQPRRAVTRFRIVRMGSDATLVEFSPRPDRRHQVRAHAAQLGHPIVGDRLYGDHTGRGRLLLHLAEVVVKHPLTGVNKRFRCEPPRLFEELVTPTEPQPESAEPPAPKPDPFGSDRGDAGAAQSDTDTGADAKAAESLAPLAHAEAPARATATPEPQDHGSWEHVAGWYDALIAQQRNDHYEQVILPSTMRVLDPQAGERVLDVACGQGVLTRLIAERGCECVGVDSAASLIEAATERSDAGIDYKVGDARRLETLNLGTFDAVACVMAIMNIEPMDPVLRGIHLALRDGGRAVLVLLHPSFRSPGQTGWQWHASEDGTTGGVQRRWASSYLSPRQQAITMNPGSRERPITTWTYHRPLESYVAAATGAGLVLDGLEEWASARRSEPGPRAEAENRARKEFPMFMAIRLRKPLL